MAVRTASAEWRGDLKGGMGTVRTESGALNTSYSFSARFEDEPGSNPEELIGAAHAGCFSMALANILAGAGHEPDRVATTARVHLEKDDEGFHVPRVELVCEAEVPGIDEEAFQEHARSAKEGCPISRLLSPGAEITLDATLAG